MLYNFVVYVVTQLFGLMYYFNNANQMSEIFPLYPSNSMSDFNASWNANYVNAHGGYLLSGWSRVLSDRTSSWWNQIASDPRLLISTIIWAICVWITVELCLILPFRWFKRLLRYPNHKLMTPQEVKRSKLK